MNRPESKPEFPANVPYGTYPRRATWPLTVLIIVFAAWFFFLVWMAVQYPAR